MITKTALTGTVVSGLLLSALSAAMAATNAMDMKFAKIAAQGGIFEVKSSQIALQKSQNQRVLSVAKRMVKEHGAANEELKTVAQNYKMTLPTDTDANHKAAIAKMSGLSGTAFDKAYIASQETAHAATIKLFESEIATGKNVGLTAFASKNLPGIEAHTKMIFQVGTTLGVHATTMPALKPAMMPSNMGGHNM